MATEDIAALRSPLAASLVEYISESPQQTYARINSIEIKEDFDVINIEVEAELPSKRLVEISNVEPLCIRFSPDDDRSPMVSAIRSDFPIGSVHTNLERGAHGVFLCLWEESWDDTRRLLSGQSLVERIRWWLSRTATGNNHEEGQGLEPLLAATAHVLLVPAEFGAGGWKVQSHRQVGGVWIYSVCDGDAQFEDGSGGPTLPVFTLEVDPQVHGALRGQPENLAALHDITTPLGRNLREELADWLVQSEQLKRGNVHFLLVLIFPLRREEGGEIEGREIWAFMPEKRLGDFGEAFGCTLADDSGTLHRNVMGKFDPDFSAQISALRVMHRVDRTSAQKFSGGTKVAGLKLVAIGAGALGSNVIVNTVKAGLGPWTAIDNDATFPHNLVRQAHPEFLTGISKSEGIATIANQLGNDWDHDAITANVLNPGESAEMVSESLARADVVVDFSASPAVLGYVSDHEHVRRAASFFFSPDGQDLVALIEDKDRQIRLDEMEAQYLLACAHRAQLKGHLADARLDFIRYANACQDLSRPLSPWKVQTLAGIASGQISELNTGFSGTVWRLTKAGGINVVDLDFTRPARAVFEDWRVTVSTQALRYMADQREEALPNETGGILLGTHDFTRKVVHIVTALPAPRDSEQSPTHFIRGTKTLKPIVDALSETSAGSINYLGEWHSHPRGVAARPSDHDENLFQYLQQNLAPSGKPYFMAIINDNEFWLRGGWFGADTAEAAFDLNEHLA